MIPILLAAAAAAAQPQAETPRAFMERLYAAYRDSDFSPFDHPERVFAPKLLAAIEEDSRLNQGEVGYLDGDPVCQCQDASGLKTTITRVRLLGRDKASVGVSIGLTGYPPRPATFSLVRTPAGWRIADVWSPDEPSMLKGIEKANREARARKH
jgi:hypothetical protein